MNLLGSNGSGENLLQPDQGLNQSDDVKFNSLETTKVSIPDWEQTKDNNDLLFKYQGSERVRFKTGRDVEMQGKLIFDPYNFSYKLPESASSANNGDALIFNSVSREMEFHPNTDAGVNARLDALENTVNALMSILTINDVDNTLDCNRDFRRV